MIRVGRILRMERPVILKKVYKTIGWKEEKIRRKVRYGNMAAETAEELFCGFIKEQNYQIPVEGEVPTRMESCSFM